MKYKNIYFCILIFITSIVLSWAIPGLVKLGTSSAPRYPFVYYSSILQDFAIRKASGKTPEFLDASGNKYTREQYDSITPLFSYRQLMMVGNMPDSLMGVALEPRVLRQKSFTWRYNPKDIRTPELGLYSLFEAMSGRASLESPEDVFRMKEKIEFIRISNNRVNEEKSEIFMQAFHKAGFTFPAKEAWGNLTVKRPYDEGYFILDSRNQLFHLKMVNGRPYVKNTNIGQQTSIAYVNVVEVPDKSIYGFVVSEEGAIYTISAEGGYQLSRLDIPDIDIRKNSVVIMTNIFYWMASVTTPDNCTHYVLNAATLKTHDNPYTIEANRDTWDKIEKKIFPVYFSISDPFTQYEQPFIKFGSVISWVPGLLLLGFFWFFIGKKRPLPNRIFAGLCIILFGIPGFIASLLIN